jgi:hypothetical protein
MWLFVIVQNIFFCFIVVILLYFDNPSFFLYNLLLVTISARALTSFWVYTILKIPSMLYYQYQGKQ